MGGIGIQFSFESAGDDFFKSKSPAFCTHEVHRPIINRARGGFSRARNIIGRVWMASQASTDWVHEERVLCDRVRVEVISWGAGGRCEAEAAVARQSQRVVMVQAPLLRRQGSARLQLHDRARLHAREAGEARGMRTGNGAI